MADHLYGSAIPIIKYLEDKTISFDEENIDKLFNHPEIQDRKIVIFSLIGAFRGGKSFFLNYCLRFLYAHFASINNPSKETQFIFENDENWMGDGDKPLKGFPWRAGTERDTTGILIWNDVFLHTFDRSGEKVAIFVMDTQGLFDNKSTQTDNSRIFSLGTLLSSIQIFNLRTIIQEDQLQYLQFATEFTKFTANDENQMEGKPFQHLTFLIRDWDNEDEFSFGIEGGKKYFEDRVIKSTTSEIEELKSVRESITNAFEQIGCCLLPHPGKKVTKKDYNGCWSNMDEDFKTELKNVVEYFLLPENLIVKKINAADISCEEIKHLFKDYLKLFASNDIPKTLTMYEHGVEVQLNNFIEKCLNEYNREIIFNADIITEDNLPIAHDMSKQQALSLYNTGKKMGDSKMIEKFREKLEVEIKKAFEIYKLQSKNYHQNHEKFMNELKKQINNLQNLNQLKEKAEEDLKHAEKKLKEFIEMKERNQIDFLRFKRFKLILEKRIKAEKERIQQVEEVLKYTIAFRKSLAVAAGIAFSAEIGILEGLFLIPNVAFHAIRDGPTAGILHAYDSVANLPTLVNTTYDKVKSSIEQGNDRFHSIKNDFFKTRLKFLSFSKDI